MTDIRNNERCILDSESFAKELWDRIQIHCKYDPRFEHRSIGSLGSPSHHAVGVNERMRFLKYGQGNYFAPHFDGSFCRWHQTEVLKEEVSLVTCLIYLNEDFDGGATRFFGEFKGSVDVIPRTGSVLLFQHRILHEGEPLIKGTKYVIRTDIMYIQTDTNGSDKCPKSETRNETLPAPNAEEGTLIHQERGERSKIEREREKAG